MPVLDEPQPPERARKQLSEEQVVMAGAALVRRGGAAALTMRALARELDMTTMAAYHYVSSREDLLSRIADAVIGGVVVPTVPAAPAALASPDATGNAPWADQLWSYMQAMHDALARYPGIDDFLLHREPTVAVRTYMANCVGIIERGGFGPAAARRAFSAIYTYMWGRGVFRGLLAASPRPPRRTSSGLPSLEELASPEDTELGFRALVVGLTERLGTVPSA